jgi:hypothetical protein
MSATAVATVKVTAKCSYAGPGWSCEKGDEIDVPLDAARRGIARGMLAEHKDHPLPKPSKEEAEAARVVEVATINAGTAEEPRYKHFENSAQVRPVTRK